jgi:hypothetical protein
MTVMGLLFAAVVLTMIIDSGDAKPSNDNLSGCDRADCHPNGEPNQVYDLTIETAAYSQDETDRFQVTVKDDNGDKWQDDRAAETSPKGNGHESDTVYDSFDSKGEGFPLDISTYTDPDYEGDDRIGHGDKVTVYAGYLQGDEYHLGKGEYTYYRPNTAPIAVPYLSLEDYMESEDNGTEYLVTDLDASGNVTIWFHANFSYDEDPEDSDHHEVEKYQWDLDMDGVFAENGDDEGDGETCPEHFKRTFDTPGEYDFDFKCSDGDKSSDIVTVRLKINKPEENPDLTFEEDIDIRTKDGSKEFHKQDTVVITFTIKNEGNDNLEDDVEVTVYNAFRVDEGDDWGDWEEISEGDIIMQYTDKDPLKPSGTDTESFEWFTGEEDVSVGFYKFMLFLDENDDIEEYLEEKNQDLPNDVETESIELEEEIPPEGDPEFVLSDFSVPAKVEILQLATISLTIENIGQGDGYVRILFYVDGTEEARTKRFTVAKETAEEVEFEWRAQNEGTWTVQAKLDWKGDIVEETEELQVEVTGILEDEDKDGLPDWWEDQYWGTTSLYDGEDDPDDDGYTNTEEWAGNTDPTDPDDYPGKGGDDDDDSPAFMTPLAAAALVFAAIVMRRRR